MCYLYRKLRVILEREKGNQNEPKYVIFFIYSIDIDIVCNLHAKLL